MFLVNHMTDHQLLVMGNCTSNTLDGPASASLRTCRETEVTRVLFCHALYEQQVVQMRRRSRGTLEYVCDLFWKPDSFAFSRNPFYISEKPNIVSCPLFLVIRGTPPPPHSYRTCFCLTHHSRQVLNLFHIHTFTWTCSSVLSDVSLMWFGQPLTKDSSVYFEYTLLSRLYSL